MRSERNRNEMWAEVKKQEQPAKLFKQRTLDHNVKLNKQKRTQKN